MRIGRLMIQTASFSVLMGLFSVPVSARGNPGAAPDDNDNKVSLPTGLNSAINVSAATLAIDDKSPMSNSINSPGSVENIRKIVAKYSIDEAVKALFSTERANFFNLLKTLNPSFVPEDDVRSVLQNLISPGPFPVDKTNLLHADTKEFLKLAASSPDSLGTMIAQRLMFRDLLVASTGLPVNSDEARKIAQMVDFTDEDCREIEDNLPSNIVHSSLYTGVQVRSGGGAATVYTPEAIYSNGRGGFDVAAQYYAADVKGYGIGFRFDLTSGRAKLVEAVLKAVQTTNRINRISVAREVIPDLNLTAQNTAILERAVLFGKNEGDYNTVRFDAAKEAIRYAKKRHVAFVAGQRGIGGIGSLTSAGLSVSQLWIPYCGRSYNGVTFLAGVQALQFSPDSKPSTATIRSGVSVYWQDRVSRIFQDKEGTHAEINRWTTQFGAEYNFHNSLQLHDTYGVFVRQRLEKFTEVGLSIGKGGNGQAFIGFNVGHTFSM